MWVTIVVAIISALPAILAEIEAITKEIQAGNGSPSPAQAVKLSAAVAAHQSLSNSVAAVCAANMPQAWPTK